MDDVIVICHSVRQNDAGIVEARFNECELNFPNRLVEHGISIIIASPRPQLNRFVKGHQYCLTIEDMAEW